MKQSTPKLTVEQELKQLKKRQQINREFYSLRSILGHHWAIFIALLGGREAGKSYAVMEQFVKDWKKKGRPFTWLRLKESSTKKMLANNAEKFVDADLVRKYDLKLSVKGTNVYDDGRKMAQILALSTFYSDKGVALFDKDFDLGYNIALDEMNPERGERKTFDILYAFVNQMENLVRSTKENIRVFLIGNTLEEASDILVAFDFLPEKFGRYKIRKKRAIIDYIAPSEKYLKRRKGTIADLLTPNESTFTNEIKADISMIYKGRLHAPTQVIMFDKNTLFTVWDSNVVKEYHNEKVTKVAMRPYLDELFIPQQRDEVIARFNLRSYYFRDLITQKKFKKYIEQLKPSK